LFVLIRHALWLLGDLTGKGRLASFSLSFHSFSPEFHSFSTFDAKAFTNLFDAKAFTNL
jgi:hypothetical protein